MQDELQEYRDEESKFDGHANPKGAEYDLGKDGEFADFVVLIGNFDPYSPMGCVFLCLYVCLYYYADTLKCSNPTLSLKKKGFTVVEEKSEKRFTELLPTADVAWIISGTDPTLVAGKKRTANDSGILIVIYFPIYFLFVGFIGERYPGWKDINKQNFTEAVMKFHMNGGGLFLWGGTLSFNVLSFLFLIYCLQITILCLSR